MSYFFKFLSVFPYCTRSWFSRDLSLWWVLEGSFTNIFHKYGAFSMNRSWVIYVNVIQQWVHEDFCPAVYIDVFLKNIDVFQTSPNTNFPPIILHSYHVLHSRISGLCSVYITIWSKIGTQSWDIFRILLLKRFLWTHFLVCSGWNLATGLNITSRWPGDL